MLEFKCVKCGNEDIAIAYGSGNDSHEERLDCVCLRCAYAWVSETLDNKKEKEC